MTRSLFRPEAIEFQKEHREFGQVGRLQAPSLKAFAWLLVVGVSSIIIFICVAGYTRKETVAGYLAPATGTAEIFVPQQGTVTDVHVAEDQLVAEGDVLLIIDTSQITADGVDVNAAVLRSLSVQKMLLTSQIDAEDRSTNSEKNRLAAAIRNGEAELAQLTSQIDFQEEQIAIAQKLVDTAHKMQAAGYISVPEVYRREEGLLDAKQSLSSLKQRYSARETELSQTRYLLQQLPTESARKLQPLRSELAQFGPAHCGGWWTPLLCYPSSDSGAELPTFRQRWGRLLIRSGSSSTSCRSRPHFKPSSSCRRGPSASSGRAKKSGCSTRRFPSRDLGRIPAASSVCPKRFCPMQAFRRPLN